MYPIVPGIISAGHRLNTDPSAAKALPEGSAGISEKSATETQRALTCSFTPTAILAAGSRYSFKLSIHAEASPAMASMLEACNLQKYKLQQAAWNRRCCELREPEQEATGCGTAKKAGGMRREESAGCGVQRRRRWESVSLWEEGVRPRRVGRRNSRSRKRQ